MKFKFLAFILIAFSINLYADEYKFDYAVIDNEKVTTVSASNITAHLISESKATVTYKNETVTLISKDGYEYKGFGESGVVIVSNRVNGVLSRITIGGTLEDKPLYLFISGLIANNILIIMDILKYIVCLIIAAIIYFIVGLIAWNIVCSWVDMSSCTLVEISNYRIYTYSGIACISAIIAEIRVGIKNGRDMDGACTILFVTGFLALMANHWESMWDSVAVILTILYNIINIVIMAYCFYKSNE